MCKSVTSPQNTPNNLAIKTTGEKKITINPVKRM
jgi:hypothetical protein